MRLGTFVARLAWILAMTMAFAACGTKQDAIQWVDASATADVTGSGDSTASGVTYTNDIRPILAVCSTCHATKYGTYANAKANAAAANSAIQAGRMPKGSALSKAQRDTFQAWIDAGMPR